MQSIANEKIYLPTFVNFSTPARLRAKTVMKLLAVKRTKFYAGIKNGIFPVADGYDPRPYWFSESVKSLVTKRN